VCVCVCVCVCVYDQQQMIVAALPLGQGRRGLKRRKGSRTFSFSEPPRLSSVSLIHFNVFFSPHPQPNLLTLPPSLPP